MLRPVKSLQQISSDHPTGLEVLDSFQKFSDIFERIQNRPEFATYIKEDVVIPAYNSEELKQVSVGAGILLGGLGGAAVGTAGGFAAAGASDHEQF